MSGYISVYVGDILDDIDDNDLLAEVKSRKLVTADVPFHAIEAAYEALRNGDHPEALLILERVVRPKWESLAAAETAYAAAMRRGASS